MAGSGVLFPELLMTWEMPLWSLALCLSLSAVFFDITPILVLGGKFHQQYSSLSVDGSMGGQFVTGCCPAFDLPVLQTNKSAQHSPLLV